MSLPDVVSGLLLSPRPPVRARAGVPTSKQHHKVISRRKRRPIDRWCCFSFPNRTHFIGLRFGSHRGANTVPFPPHGENCTMLAPSSFSESNPLRWASIRVFKVISHRRRRPIDRWCCFSFPNRTHFIGLRFGSHRGANTVPFPPHGENCTMLAPSSFSESNPLRWASIRVFKVISRRRRRPIDRWCCFFLSKSNPFHWASIWFPSRSQHRSVSALR